MAIKDSDTLKSYFNLSKVPTPSNYVDLVDTIFSRGAGGGSGHDHDDRYVQLNIGNTIHAIHTFSPSTYGPPFILGDKAQGQTISGLKADQLNKSISVSGLGLSGGGTLTADRTISLASSSAPGGGPSILASDNDGYLSLNGFKTDYIWDKSGSNLTIAPTGDITLDPGGNDILPMTNYDLNLGQINKKYLTLHAAELWVETLVAANVMSTIGGRVLIAPTDQLFYDLGAPTQLMTNVGFENWAGGLPVGWTVIAEGGGSVSSNGATFHGGATSVQIYNGTSGFTRVEQQVTIPSGQIFTLSFWCRGYNGRDGQYYIWDAIHGAMLAGPYRTENHSDTWTRVMFTIYIPPEDTVINVGFGGDIDNFSSTCYFDDVSLTVDVFGTKYNQMAPGDTVYMEADGKIEWFRIRGGPYLSGDHYNYYIERDVDWTGTNTWFAGDAIVNTGQIGDGYIDLYSVRGVLSGYGPTIAGMVRYGNDWHWQVGEAWAIGNLNGLYGYGADTYGFAAGRYALNLPFVTVDPTNGIRMNYRNAFGFDQTRFLVDNSGDVFIGVDISAAANTYFALFSATQTYNGEVMTAGDLLLGDNSASSGNVFWDSSAASLIIRAGTVKHIEMLSNGNVYIGEATGVAATTFIAVFTAATTWNTESMSAGDVLIGNNSTSKANVFWDKSAGTLNFRSAKITKSYIDIDGAFTVKSNTSGVMDRTAGMVWEDATPADIAMLAVYNTGVLQGVELKCLPITGRVSSVYIRAVTPAAGYTPNVSLIATKGTTSSSIAVTDVKVDITTPDFYFGNNTTACDVTFTGVQTFWKSTGLTYNIGLFHPLITPLTSTAYDGDLFSTTAKTAFGTIQSVFGVPAGIKAVLCRVEVYNSAAGDYWLTLSPNATAYSGPAVGVAGLTAGAHARAMIVVPCSAAGELYYQIAASGTNTFSVSIQIWGYWL